MDWDAYGRRCGLNAFPQDFRGALKVETLRTLQRAHQQAIPFENLDVFLKRPLDLSLEGLAQKLIVAGRGGWCFETNELLAQALEVCGYPLRRLMARSLLAPDKPRTHQVLLVRSEEQTWLVDAGFGGLCPRVPHPLAADSVVDHDGVLLRLQRRPGSAWSDPDREPDTWVLQNRRDGAWADLYGFSNEAFLGADYLAGNLYHQVSPLSLFTQKRIVVAFQPGRRWTLTDRTVKEWVPRNGEEVVDRSYELASAEELGQVLADQAGIVLSREDLTRIWA